MKEILSSQLFMMQIPEMIAVITGIASVWFAKKENILVFPIGMVSVAIYVYLCVEVKLFADAAINAYYFIVSIYGWYFWKKGILLRTESIQQVLLDQDVHEKPIIKNATTISFQSLNQNLLFLFYTVLIWIVLAFFLVKYTSSDVAWWDAFTTAVFFIAMILMARKKIENWIFWIVGDAASIPLFIYKGLYLSSIQFLIFTIIAIAGFISWYRKLQAQYEAEQIQSEG